MQDYMYNNDYSKKYTVDGEKLTTEEVTNLITILGNPELSRLFNAQELSVIKLAVRTNINSKMKENFHEVDQSLDKLPPLDIESDNAKAFH